MREEDAVELLTHILHNSLGDNWNDVEIRQEHNDTWTIYINIGEPSTPSIMTDQEIEVLVDNELERIRHESHKQ